MFPLCWSALQFSVFCVQIGTEFLRGVSGGERKRCSIGMELITSPSLLFLDEPTTGLDSNTANCIINLLYRYSTITHQGETLQTKILFIIFPVKFCFLNISSFTLVERRNIYHLFYYTLSFCIAPVSSSENFFSHLHIKCVKHSKYLMRSCHIFIIKHNRKCVI